MNIWGDEIKQEFGLYESVKFSWKLDNCWFFTTSLATLQLKWNLTIFNLSIFSIFPTLLSNSILAESSFLLDRSYFFRYRRLEFFNRDGWLLSKSNTNHLYLKVTFILSKDCILYQVVIQLKSGFCSAGSSSCTIISHHFSSRIIFIFSNRLTNTYSMLLNRNLNIRMKS